MARNEIAVDKLLIVGNIGGTNIGGSFFRAGQRLGFNMRLAEMSEASDAPKWCRRFNWWVRGKRPTWLGRFSKRVIKTAAEIRPHWLLATGTAPLSSEALEEIGRLGVIRINYLTDDPFSPAHKAKWFLKALPKYDFVFSPRRSNLGDLKQLGCPSVSYLPFAYDEDIFFAESSAPGEEYAYSSDVVFVGGADKDRIPYFAALGAAGFHVSLYGDYWHRYPETRGMYRGYADPHILRKAIAGAGTALCLVRRANRDGHCMRTFEIPAIGACILIEDTEEHREIFGEDGKAVVYFSSIPQMVERLGWLKERSEERLRLARSSHELITGGRHTYRDRLTRILLSVNEG